MVQDQAELYICSINRFYDWFITSIRVERARLAVASMAQTGEGFVIGLSEKLLVEKLGLL